MGLAEHMEVIVTMPSGTVSKETPSQRQALSPEKKKKNLMLCQILAWTYNHNKTIIAAIGPIVILSVLC